MGLDLLILHVGGWAGSVDVNPGSASHLLCYWATFLNLFATISCSAIWGQGGHPLQVVPRIKESPYVSPWHGVAPPRAGGDMTCHFGAAPGVVGVGHRLETGTWCGAVRSQFPERCPGGPWSSEFLWRWGVCGQEYPCLLLPSLACEPRNRPERNFWRHNNLGLMKLQKCDILSSFG